MLRKRFDGEFDFPLLEDKDHKVIDRYGIGRQGLAASVDLRDRSERGGAVEICRSELPETSDQRADSPRINQNQMTVDPIARSLAAS